LKIENWFKTMVMAVVSMAAIFIKENQMGQNGDWQAGSSRSRSTRSGTDGGATEAMARLEGLFAHWVAGFEATTRQQIRKKGLVAGGNLANARAQNQTDDPEILRMVMYFRDYGRFQDMRRRGGGSAGGTDMLNALQDWVQKIGIQSFMRGDYAARFAGKSETRIAYEIAWGIITNYRKFPPKPVKWWNKHKTREYQKLYRLLISAYTNMMRDAVDE
jgi:hypothetical protein